MHLIFQRYLNYLDVHITESTVGDFIVEYESVAGDDYHSTYVRGVEEIVITTQPEEYFYHLAGSDGDRQNSDVQGTFTDAYDYLGAGVGDLGDMYYVSTDQSLAGTTGVDGTVSGDIYYSGHHTDFDRNTSASSYGTAAALTGIINNNGVNVWNDDVTEFFTFYDNAAGGQFEIAVVYDTSKQAWRVNNEHFDTFQNVGVDETLAGELSDALGVDVEAGDYRVFYSAAFADIDAVLEENDGVDPENWTFDFEPSISRSTFYIEVGGDATGYNGDSGLAPGTVTNVEVTWDGTEFGVAFEDDGSLPTPLVNLPTFGPNEMGDVAQSVIADDLSQIVVGGVGSDVLQGRGGADTYNIIGGDASGANNLYTDYEGNAIVGDIINEIGGRLADKGDSVQFSDSSANGIDVTDISQFSFERVRIRNEDEGSTLKITADYNKDGNADDTVFIFDQYNEDQGFRQVEQLLLDDGWDPDEAWNLITGEQMNTPTYNDPSVYTDIDMFRGTAGHDVIVTNADSGMTNRIHLNGDSDLVVLANGASDRVSLQREMSRVNEGEESKYYAEGNPLDTGVATTDDVDWSAASNNAVHQILNFVSGEDYIDLRYLDIEAPDGAGIDIDLHQDGGNTYMYQQDHDNGGNIEILAEFVGVSLDEDDIEYTPEIV